MITTVEYAGFQYEIHEKPTGYEVIPAWGQHRAAMKEKHRRAALQCYLENKA